MTQDIHGTHNEISLCSDEYLTQPVCLHVQCSVHVTGWLRVNVCSFLNIPFPYCALVGTKHNPSNGNSPSCVCVCPYILIQLYTCMCIGLGGEEGGARMYTHPIRDCS